MKKLLFAVALCACFASAFADNPPKMRSVCSNVTATGTTTPVALESPLTFQAAMTVSSGSGTATVAVECTVNGSGYVALWTTSITDTTTTIQTVDSSQCVLYRCNASALTGTGAKLSVVAGSKP